MLRVDAQAKCFKVGYRKLRSDVRVRMVMFVGYQGVRMVAFVGYQGVRTVTFVGCRVVLVGYRGVRIVTFVAGVYVR